MTGGADDDDEDLDFDFNWPEGPREDFDMWANEPRRPWRRRKKKDRGHSGEESAAFADEDPTPVPAAKADPAGPEDPPEPPKVETAPEPPAPTVPAAKPPAPTPAAPAAKAAAKPPPPVAATPAADDTARRVERVTSALAAEMAEIAQTISDETGRQAAATQEAVRSAASQVSADFEALREALAERQASSGGTGPGPSGPALDLLAQATERVESLLEDLLVALEERPADVSELTSRVIQQLAVDVGARVEAATTTGIDTLDDAIDQAIARAADQLKQLAPPKADRSTTSAVERLEERVAALSRQREADAAETRQLLDDLGATVARLASARAGDLQQVLDAVEAARPPAKAEGEDDQLSGLVEAVEAIANLPSTTDELVSVIADQTEVLNTELEAVRRRLSLRARTTLDQASLEQLADLVAARLRQQD